MLNEDVSDSINWLVSKVGTNDNQPYLKEIISTICKLSAHNLHSGDWKLLSRSIRELRHSFRVFTPYRSKRKVSIFGSARTHPSHPSYEQAEMFSKQIVAHDFMVITGAGGGIMDAGNKGAGDNSFGVNIRLPFEQSPNEHIINSQKLVTYNYFFIRKLMFIMESDATVLFPGGFGTLDEAYEGLTLIQTGKSMPRPIVLVQDKGSKYWDIWYSFFTDVMLKEGYISPDDLDLVTICHSPEEAVQIVVNFYTVYHSLRYVKDDAVIRLNHPISNSQIDQLNALFADIIVSGKIEACEPYTEEVMSKDHLKKFRLTFKFNRIQYGRLVSMIRHINTFKER